MLPQLGRLPRRVFWLSGLIAIGLIFVGFQEWRTYAMFHTLDDSTSLPPEIHWCGRDYSPSVRDVSKEQIATDSTTPLTQIATTPSGRAVLAVQAQGQSSAPCTTVIYVTSQENHLRPYALLGGP